MSFPTTVLLLFQGPIQDVIFQVVVVSLYSPLICDSFSVFPCFSSTWQFWKVLVKYFVDALQFGFSDVFWWGRGLGDEYYRGKVPFSSHYTEENTWWIWLITGGINLDHLVKVVFARFFHCQIAVTFPTGHSLSFASKLLIQVGEGIKFYLFKGRELHTLFAVLCKEDLSPLPHLFLHNLFTPVWTHGYLCYTLDSNPMLFTSLLKLSQLCPLGALSGSLLFPFYMPHLLNLLCIYFLSTFFQALRDVPGLSCTFAALWSAIYSRSPGAFHRRLVLYV